MARPIQKERRSMYGWLCLALGCFLEFSALESIHSGQVAHIPVIGLLLFSASMIFIILGLSVIWRQHSH